MAAVRSDTFTDTLLTALSAHLMDVGDSGPNSTGWVSQAGTWVIGFIRRLDQFGDTLGTALASHNMNVGDTGTFTTGWVALSGTWQIGAGNIATLTSTTASAEAADDTGSADGVIKLDVTTPNAASYIGGVCFRCSDASNGWIATLERDGGGTPYLSLLKRAAGVNTGVSTQTLDSSVTNATVTITVTLIGNSVTASVPGFAALSTSDAYLNTATKHGLFGFSASGYTSASFDNFIFYTNPGRATASTFTSTQAQAVDDSGLANCSVSVVVTTPNGINYSGGLVVRSSDANTGWIVAVERDGAGTPFLGIFQRTAGVNTTRASTTLDSSFTGADVTLRVDLDGGSIVARVNGTHETAYYSTTNATVTKHGLYGFVDTAGYQMPSYDSYAVNVLDDRLPWLPPRPGPPDSPPDRGHPSFWASPWMPARTEGAGLSLSFLPSIVNPPGRPPDRGYPGVWLRPWIQPQAPRPGQTMDYFRPPPPGPQLPRDRGYPALFPYPWLYPQKPPAPLVPIPLLVTWNQAADSRTRQHERVVSEIMNSLIRNLAILRTEVEIWELGYAPSDDTSWADSVQLPLTVTEALDRIAAALVALGMKP